MLTAFWLGQAATVVLWWALLWTTAGVRALFAVPGWPPEVLLAFALPDGVVLVSGSLVAVVVRGHARATAAWFVCGGGVYAFLWCLAASLATGGGWTGAGTMAACAFANAVAARSARRRARE